MPVLMNGMAQIVTWIILLTLLIFAVRICVQDALRRGKSPLLVCLIAIFFFPMGTIAWLLFRPEPTDSGGSPRPFRLRDHRVQ